MKASDVKLYLDDIRKAPDESWTVVRSFEEFQRHIDEHGMPAVVSFDHDLGHGQAYTKPRGKRVWIPREQFADIPTGYDACKWMIDNFGLPADVRIHSMNPIGAEDQGCPVHPCPCNRPRG